MKVGQFMQNGRKKPVIELSREQADQLIAVLTAIVEQTAAARPDRIDRHEVHMMQITIALLGEVVRKLQKKRIDGHAEKYKLKLSHPEAIILMDVLGRMRGNGLNAFPHFLATVETILAEIEPNYA